MKQALARRAKSDRGDSTLVTFVLVMPLFFMFVVSMIDTSAYFSNRATVQQVARDGARQVAILGGDGDATSRTALEAQYGRTGTCAAVPNAATRAADQTEVECQVLQRMDMGGLTNVQVQRVDCGPSFVVTVGQETYCNVTWTYGGVPGSALSFIKGRDGESKLHSNETRVTARAEASTNGITAVPR